MILFRGTIIEVDPTLVASGSPTAGTHSLGVGHAAALGAALGRAIEYVQLPMSEIRKNSEDFALMLEWFERVGYNADIPALEREFGVTSTSFGAWAKRWAAGQRTA